MDGDKQGTVTILDPSPIYRPDLTEKAFEGIDFQLSDKEMEKFRRFAERSEEDDERIKTVKHTYKLMHTHQTVDYVREKRAHWGKLDHARLTIMEALDFMINVIDESDPDLDVPNIYHAFQTAEKIRARHPDKDWFILTGLVHDLGKVMAAWGEPQWSVVGDTFAVGCAPVETIVYGRDSFVDNPDLNNPAYNSKCGIYEENCGLANVMLSWGHDEYMYRVLVENNSKLPDEALYVIRFHSCFPWHHGGDYDHLCNDKDKRMLKWVREFKTFDLYSKDDEMPDIEAIRPYYQALIDKYIPGTLRW